MWLTRLCLRYPVFAVMLMLVFVVLGLFAWRMLSVDEYPDVEFPYVVITTTYPGAAPEAVELEVTRPLEEAVNTVPGVRRIISWSFEGQSRIAVEFVLKVSASAAVQDVRDRIAPVRSRFRSEVQEPLVEQFRPDQLPVYSLAFVAQASGVDSAAQLSLSHYVLQQVLPRLQNIPGVGRVEVSGASPREVRVEVDTERLREYGIGMDQLMTAMRNDNVMMPAGVLAAGSRERSVLLSARMRKPEDFNDVVVAVRGQAAVTLSQLARVQEQGRVPESLALFNGKRAVSVDIVRTPGANTIALVDALREQLPALQAEAPAGIAVLTIADASRSIRASLADVRNTLLEGALLAILIVFVFLGSWRSTVITGLALPVSLLGAVFCLYLFGLTLNMMTLMALSLSIGLLVDDAIVVRENILRHVAMGKSSWKAALDGTREIGLAVLATTLTIVAVFLPVAFMGGIIGRFFYQFGVAVSCAVLLSMLVSFTLDPMLSSRWRDPDAGPENSVQKNAVQKKRWLADRLGAFQQLLQRLSARYVRVLRWALAHRPQTLMLGLLSLLLALVLATRVGTEFVPEPDLGEIAVHFSTPVGSTLAYSERKAQLLSAVLRAYPGVSGCYAAINTGMDIGKHKVVLRVLLKSKDQRRSSQSALVRQFRERLQGMAGIELTSVAAARESLGGFKPVQLSLQGRDLQQLERLSAVFHQRLASVPGVADLESSLKNPKPALALDIQRERAAEMGLSLAQVAAVLRLSLSGEVVSSWLSPEGENYDVRVQLPEAVRANADDLMALPVAGQVQLGQIAHIREHAGVSQINRRNLSREVLFSANVAGRPVGDVMKDIEAVAATIALPSGYRFVVQGQSRDMQESVAYAKTALLLGAVFIYMLLATQFNSFLHPLTIMTSLPLSLAGVFLALWICGSTLNLFSIIGIVTLMGLVTKNAILLVDFIQQAMREGMDRTQAILSAGQIRLRPILMTTAAMVAGMLPLALGLGEGAEQRAPMAHALIGGVLCSTVLTLVIVPVVFSLLEDMRLWLWDLWHAGKRDVLIVDVDSSDVDSSDADNHERAA